jgi:hypothetical protein
VGQVGHPVHRDRGGHGGGDDVEVGRVDLQVLGPGDRQDRHRHPGEVCARVGVEELARPACVDPRAADPRHVGGGGAHLRVVGRDLRLEVGAEQPEQPPHRGRQGRRQLPGLPAQQLVAGGRAAGQQHQPGQGCAAGGERGAQQRALAVPGHDQPGGVDLGAGGEGVAGRGEVVDVVGQPGRPPVAGAAPDAALVVAERGEAGRGERAGQLARHVEAHPAVVGVAVERAGAGGDQDGGAGAAVPVREGERAGQLLVPREADCQLPHVSRPGGAGG